MATEALARVRPPLATCDAVLSEVVLADACLVRMSEIEPNASILTLDEDFEVYRRNGRGIIKVIAPWARTG